MGTVVYGYGRAACYGYRACYRCTQGGGPWTMPDWCTMGHDGLTVPVP